MDVNKNSYTFLFAILMVIVVAALLSTAAIQLKPFQDVNVVLEKTKYFKLCRSEYSQRFSKYYLSQVY